MKQNNHFKSPLRLKGQDKYSDSLLNDCRFSGSRKDNYKNKIFDEEKCICGEFKQKGSAGNVEDLKFL